MRLVLACHECRQITMVNRESKEHDEFFKLHHTHGRFTAFDPTSEDGRRHAVMAGVPYSAVNDYMERAKTEN